MIIKKIFNFLNNIAVFSKNTLKIFYESLKYVLVFIKKDILIRKAQKEIRSIIEDFKKDFEKLINKYYEFLPLPHGKSIIENKLKNGKNIYLVIFNDTRKRSVETVEVFYEAFMYNFPKHYEILQRINMDYFLGKIKENAKREIINLDNKFFNN